MDQIRTELPRWLSSASLAWMGALLALLAVLLAVSFIWYEAKEIDSRELQSTETLARLLEDHANRTFNTLDVSLASLAEAVRVSARSLDPARLGPVLAQTQQNLPFLRSLSLIDERGRVLASTADANVDVLIDLNRIPLPTAGSINRLGSLVAGRDLAEANPGVGTGRDTGPNPHQFIPSVRAVSSSPDAKLYLVAALNPDYFANEYQLILGDPSRSAAMFNIDGVLLAATEGIRMLPGASADHHRFFKEFLPAHESGAYIGVGIDTAKVVTAFRTLRKQPVCVFVERDYESVRAELTDKAAWVVAACVVALAVIFTMVGMGWRSLRSHEAVHDMLESTRERVATSERDLRTLVESVQELIFRTDPQGRIVFVNDRWEEISGRRADAALGQRLSELCLQADRAAIDDLFEIDTVRSPGAQMVQIETLQGGRRTLEVSVTAVRTADLSLAGFAGFAIDVSERQLARQNLQAQLDFRARLLEVSPTPLFVKDAHGRFVTVNRAWLDLMALTSEQVIGYDSFEVFGSEGPQHVEHDRLVLHSEDSVRYENRLLRTDGEQRDTVVSKVRFTSADGSTAGIVGSIVDVTEFREAERTTREARDAAERANRAKSEFIANISHELRTPLQSILGFSELGGNMARGHPTFHEMFDDIQAGGRRMLTLVNGLLDVSKLESTVGSLVLSSNDLAALVGDVVRELRPLAARQDLRVELPSPLRPLSADVDSFRIQQVFRNVLANALRFAPAGSCIDVGLHDLGAAGVEVSVRDHGPGIPIDELEAIFDAFVQSSRTRDGSGGTGLGLTICRKIMSAHGGSIDAGNALGGGALFRIHLPAAGSHTNHAMSSEAEARTGAALLGSAAHEARA